MSSQEDDLEDLDLAMFEESSTDLFGAVENSSHGESFTSVGVRSSQCDTETNVKGREVEPFSPYHDSPFDDCVSIHGQSNLLITSGQIQGSRGTVSEMSLVQLKESHPLLGDFEVSRFYEDQPNPISPPELTSVALGHRPASLLPLTHFGSEQSRNHRADRLCLDRLPGENLGMVLAIDGDVDNRQPVSAVTVKCITPGGAVARLCQAGSRLLIGDEITEINGVRLDGLTHDQCLGLLQETEDHMVLTVRRPGQDQPSSPSHSFQPSSRTNSPTKQTGSNTDLLSSARPSTPLPAPRRSLSTSPKSADAPFSLNTCSIQSTNHSPDAPSAMTLCLDNVLSKHFRSIQVSIARGSDSSLGFSIVPSCGATSDLYQIKRIQPHARGVQPDRVRVGDRLLACNGGSLRGLTQAQCLQVLAGAGNWVTLTLLRPRGDTQDVPTNGSNTEHSFLIGSCTNTISTWENDIPSDNLGEYRLKQEPHYQTDIWASPHRQEQAFTSVTARWGSQDLQPSQEHVNVNSKCVNEPHQDGIIPKESEAPVREIISGVEHISSIHNHEIDFNPQGEALSVTDTSNQFSYLGIQNDQVQNITDIDSLLFGTADLDNLENHALIALPLTDKNQTKSNDIFYKFDNSKLAAENSTDNTRQLVAHHNTDTIVALNTHVTILPISSVDSEDKYIKKIAISPVNVFEETVATAQKPIKSVRRTSFTQSISVNRQKPASVTHIDVVNTENRPSPEVVASAAVPLTSVVFRTHGGSSSQTLTSATIKLDGSTQSAQSIRVDEEKPVDTTDSLTCNQTLDTLEPYNVGLQPPTYSMPRSDSGLRPRSSEQGLPQEDTAEAVLTLSKSLSNNSQPVLSDFKTAGPVSEPQVTPTLLERNPRALVLEVFSQWATKESVGYDTSLQNIIDLGADQQIKTNESVSINGPSDSDYNSCSKDAKSDIADVITSFITRRSNISTRDSKTLHTVMEEEIVPTHLTYDQTQTVQTVLDRWVHKGHSAGERFIQHALEKSKQAHTKHASARDSSIIDEPFQTLEEWTGNITNESETKESVKGNPKITDNVNETNISSEMLNYPIRIDHLGELTKVPQIHKVESEILSHPSGRTSEASLNHSLPDQNPGHIVMRRTLNQSLGAEAVKDSFNASQAQSSPQSIARRPKSMVEVSPDRRTPYKDDYLLESLSEASQSAAPVRSLSAVRPFSSSVAGINLLGSVTPLQRPVSMTSINTTAVNKSNITSYPKTRQESGTPFQVDVLKGIAGLGLKVSVMPEGHTKITDIQHGGPVDKSGQVRVGDYLLMVNSTDLAGLTDARVQQTLRLLPRGLTKLIVSGTGPSLDTGVFSAQKNTPSEHLITMKASKTCDVVNISLPKVLESSEEAQVTSKDKFYPLPAASQLQPQLTALQAPPETTAAQPQLETRFPQEARLESTVLKAQLESRVPQQAQLESTILQQAQLESIIQQQSQPELTILHSKPESKIPQLQPESGVPLLQQESIAPQAETHSQHETAVPAPAQTPSALTDSSSDGKIHSDWVDSATNQCVPSKVDQLYSENITTFSENKLTFIDTHTSTQNGSSYLAQLSPDVPSKEATPLLYTHQPATTIKTPEPTENTLTAAPNVSDKNLADSSTNLSSDVRNDFKNNLPDVKTDTINTTSHFQKETKSFWPDSKKESTNLLLDFENKTINIKNNEQEPTNTFENVMSPLKLEDETASSPPAKVPPPVAPKPAQRSTLTPSQDVGDQAVGPADVTRDSQSVSTTRKMNQQFDTSGSPASPSTPKLFYKTLTRKISEPVFSRNVFNFPEDPKTTHAAQSTYTRHHVVKPSGISRQARASFSSFSPPSSFSSKDNSIQTPATDLSSGNGGGLDDRSRSVLSPTRLNAALSPRKISGGSPTTPVHKISPDHNSPETSRKLSYGWSEQSQTSSALPSRNLLKKFQTAAEHTPKTSFIPEQGERVSFTSNYMTSGSSHVRGVSSHTAPANSQVSTLSSVLNVSSVPKVSSVPRVSSVTSPWKAEDQMGDAIRKFDNLLLDISAPRPASDMPPNDPILLSSTVVTSHKPGTHASQASKEFSDLMRPVAAPRKTAEPTKLEWSIETTRRTSLDQRHTQNTDLTERKKRDSLTEFSNLVSEIDMLPNSGDIDDTDSRRIESYNTAEIADMFDILSGDKTETHKSGENQNRNMDESIHLFDTLCSLDNADDPFSLNFDTTNRNQDNNLLVASSITKGSSNLVNLEPLHASLETASLVNTEPVHVSDGATSLLNMEPIGVSAESAPLLNIEPIGVSDGATSLVNSEPVHVSDGATSLINSEPTLAYDVSQSSHWQAAQSGTITLDLDPSGTVPVLVQLSSPLPPDEEPPPLPGIPPPLPGAPPPVLDPSPNMAMGSSTDWLGDTVLSPTHKRTDVWHFHTPGSQVPEKSTQKDDIEANTDLFLSPQSNSDMINQHFSTTSSSSVSSFDGKPTEKNSDGNEVNQSSHSTITDNSYTNINSTFPKKSQIPYTDTDAFFDAKVSIATDSSEKLHDDEKTNINLAESSMSATTSSGTHWPAVNQQDFVVDHPFVVVWPKSESSQPNLTQKLDFYEASWGQNKHPDKPTAEDKTTSPTGYPTHFLKESEAYLPAPSVRQEPEQELKVTEEIDVSHRDVLDSAYESAALEKQIFLPVMKSKESIVMMHTDTVNTSLLSPTTENLLTSDQSGILTDLAQNFSDQSQSTSDKTKTLPAAQPSRIDQELLLPTIEQPKSLTEQVPQVPILDQPKSVIEQVPQVSIWDQPKSLIDQATSLPLVKHVVSESLSLHDQSVSGLNANYKNTIQLLPATNGNIVSPQASQLETSQNESFEQKSNEYFAKEKLPYSTKEASTTNGSIHKADLPAPQPTVRIDLNRPTVSSVKALVETAGSVGAGIHHVVMTKGATGIGFCIEGGVGSPRGDLPISVKRIFKGGPAEKCGQLKVGDEIIEANGVKLGSMGHYQAWNHLKFLDDGQVHLTVRRK